MSETPRLTGEAASTEMSSRRTGMSFQRTRMSADRTLMSVIRTALSLIGFGFTIAQVFEKLKDTVFSNAHAPRMFGLALIAVGIGMLVLGILYHLQFTKALAHTREEMRAEGLIHAESPWPRSLTLVTAIALLVIGVVAIISMAV